MSTKPARNEPKTSNIKHTIFKGILVFWIIALALFTYVFYIDYEPDTRSDFEKLHSDSTIDMRHRVPYVVFRSESNVGQQNSRGWHSPELPVEKAADEFRIAMIGGSVVWAGHPTYEGSIVARLSKILQEKSADLKDKNVTYINAGIVSAVSGQELTEFLFHVKQMNIDLLIVLDGFNDFYCGIQNYDPRPGYPFDYFVQEYRYYNYKTNQKWLTTFKSLFHPENFKKVTMHPSAEYSKALGLERLPYPEQKKQILYHYFRNIEMMGTIANAYGIKAAIFLQPYSIENNPPTTPTNIQFLEVYEEARDRYNELFAQNNENKLHYDLSQMNEQLSPQFADVVHLYDEGKQIVADKMYEVMKQTGMLK